MSADRATAATPYSCKRPPHVRLLGPFKGRSVDFHLRKWGVRHPLDWDALEQMTHHANGGWGHVVLPSAAEMASYVRKASRHPDGAGALMLLARLALFSQMDMAEALALGRRILSQHPARANAAVIHEWRDYGVLALHALMARWPKGVGLLDPGRALRQIQGLRDDLNRYEVEIADRKYAELRAKFSHLGVGDATRAG